MTIKIQVAALASLAALSAGCLAVTPGIIANEKEELSINAANHIEENGNSCNIWAPGNAVYLGVDNSGDWQGSNAKFAIILF